MSTACPNTACPNTERLVLHADGELDAAAHAAVSTHLAACDRCRARAATLADIDRVLGDIEPAPTGLQTRLVMVASRPAPRDLRLPAVAAAAAILLAIGWFARPGDDTHPTTVVATVETDVDLPTQVRSALRAGDDALLEALGAQVIPTLHTIARSSDAAAARRAIAWLGNAGHTGSLPVLSSTVKRIDRRGASIEALAALGDPRGVAALESLLDDAVSGPAALHAVIRIGGPASVRVIADRVAGAPEAEAGLLVAELARIDGPAGTRALAALYDEHPALADVIRVAVAGHPSVRVHLAEAAREGGEAEAARALSLLARVATPDLVEALVPLLGERDRRNAAARALVHIDTPASANALLRHVQIDGVRAAFQGAGPVTEAWLADLAARGSRHDRRQAIELLGLCGGAGSVDVLIASTRDRALAPAALQALGRIGGPAAVDALSQLGRRVRLQRHVVAALGATSDRAAVAPLERLGEVRALRGPAIDALAQIPHPEAVAAILHLDGGGKLRSGTTRALRTMDRDVVTGTLTAMLDTRDARGARHALAAVGRRP